MNKYEAVIFDFDYTLGDSTNGIWLSVNYGLEKLGFEAKSKEEVSKTIGLSLVDTYMTLTKRQDESEAKLFAKYFVEKADEVMVDNTDLYPSAKEVLQKLSDSTCKVGIVTTKYRYRIEAILDKFGMRDVIDMIVGGEDVKVQKPSPEGLLLAIAHMGTDKTKVLYVGDSIVDAQTAQRAGVDFAGVLTGTTEKDAFEQYKSVCIAKDLFEIYNLP